MKNPFLARITVPCLILMAAAVYCWPVTAADDNVVIKLGSNANPPIFSWDNVAPDNTYSQDFTFDNGTELDTYITKLSFDFHPLTQGDDAAQHEFLNDLHLSIKDKKTGAVIFDKTAEWLKQNSVDCDIDLPKGSLSNYTAIAWLDRASTNAVQGMNVSFDVRFQVTSSDTGGLLNPKTAGRNITIALLTLTIATCFFIAAQMLRRRRVRQQSV